MSAASCSKPVAREVFRFVPFAFVLPMLDLTLVASSLCLPEQVRESAFAISTSISPAALGSGNLRDTRECQKDSLVNKKEAWWVRKEMRVAPDSGRI